MTVPKIIQVVPEKNFMLLVRFSNGKERYFDCKEVMQRNEYYHRLKNPHYFKNVHIDPGGHGVSWDDEVDISEYELYKYGQEPIG